MAYEPLTYREEGGNRLVVASGGSLDVESGGEIDIESGGSLKLAGTAITASADEINALSTQQEFTADGGITANDIVYVSGWDSTNSRVKMKKAKAKAHAVHMMERVGIPDAAQRFKQYPHEMSGGLRQRAMIAMALSCRPALLIADEPTTALDVTLQLQILNLIHRLKDQFSIGVLFISHDLGVVKEIADKISVIYAGKIIESTTTNQLFENPRHPYTRLLMLSIPDATKRGSRLRSIPGAVPDAEHIPSGCSFHPRCPLAEPDCRKSIPPTKTYGDNHTAACFLIGKKWIDLST